MSTGRQPEGRAPAAVRPSSAAGGSSTRGQALKPGRRRIDLLLVAWAVVLGSSLVALGAAPASAATYPPTPPSSPGTGVLGTKTGVVSNSGLPHTGFDPSLLLVVGGLLIMAGVASFLILRVQIAASRR